MKLIIIICTFILFDVDIARSRIIQETLDREDQDELGYDEGEGKGAKFDDTDDANAKDIDLETQDPPGVNYIQDAIEEGARQHYGSKWFKEGDILLSREEVEGGERSAATNKRKLWKKYGGFVHVPYVISSSYTAAERANIDRAIQEFREKTCIRLVLRDRTNSQYYPDYLSIFRGKGCFSSVGCQYKGKQQLSLGYNCANDVGTPIHEIMHALGYWHEQSRPDRDDYIWIYRDNIDDRMEYNFNKCKGSECSTQNHPYDFDSVMHYGKTAFSMNGRQTMARKGCLTCSLGQRNRLSEWDVKGLNLLYSCSGTDGDTDGDTGKDCEDQNQSCSGWRNKGYCTGQFEEYMKKNCAKTCNACGVSEQKYFVGTQGKASCSNGDLIYDASTCKNACDELSIPKQEILGSYVCYKDSKGKCYQNGHNGGGASMVCKKSGYAHPPN